jgi:signal transduction histidine kinase
MINLPLNDAGIRGENMPFQWFLNAFVYAAVGAVGSAVGWIFDRSEEAVELYERTALLQAEAENLAAAGEARAEARRELHASLQQYVRAALLRLDLVRRVSGGTQPLDEVERRLEEMRDSLLEITTELASPGSAGTSGQKERVRRGFRAGAPR